MLWLVTFALMLLCVAGMAVGVMAGRKPIAGSCGGIGAAGVDASCTLCGGNPNKCEESKQGAGSTATQTLGYDATRKE